MWEAGKVVTRLQEMRDEGYLSDAILREAVKQIEAADPRYDWVGVYLLNRDENVLWLHNYVGEGAEHARIPVGTGVCGTAVAEGRDINVPDVEKFPGYLACSPATRSELVVLIRTGSEVFGQIDIDSHKPAAFEEADEEAVRMVAEKLAEVFVAERR